MAEADQPAPEPTSILAVDDHRENLVALESILTRTDYRLLTAQCARSWR
jgi:PleD family two-component response regulator